MRAVVKAVSLWHLLILSLLVTIIVIGSYGVLLFADFLVARIFYLFFGSLLASLMYIIFTSTLLFTKDEVRYGLWHISSVKLDRVEWRLNGRILVLGKYNWFLVLERNKMLSFLSKPEANESNIKELGKNHISIFKLMIFFFSILLISYLLLGFYRFNIFIATQAFLVIVILPLMFAYRVYRLTRNLYKVMVLTSVSALHAIIITYIILQLM